MFDAVTIVLKPFYMAQLGVKRLLSFETISSTDAAPPLPGRGFVPNIYRDITAHLERKLEIMRLYEQQMQPEPLPRSESAIRALARVRGATIAVPYAEAMMLLRQIE